MNFTRNRVATAAIAPYRIVKGTTTDSEVTQSSAAGDKHVGVTGQIGADGAADRVDIHHAGPVRMQCGGAVAFGDFCTSDADGKAVVAQKGQRCCLIALENGAADEIIDFLLVDIPASSLNPGTTAVAIAFTTNAYALPAADVVHDACYAVPLTAGASTIDFPAGAPDETRIHFIANGTLNGHTVTYRDATGAVALTAALTASKRHMVTAIKKAGAWYASAHVSP